jgi:hypothetical protein
MALSPSQFWMLVRWGGPKDIREAECEEAAAAGVTDFDNDGMGLCYNRKDDADAVARRMAVRFGIEFDIWGAW